MSRSTLFTLCLCLVLAGCGTTSSENLLTRYRAEEDLANTLANFIIQKEPFTLEAGVREQLERNIESAKARMQRADDSMRGGKLGALIGIKVPVTGTALLKGNVVYLSSDFETKPGLLLHAYLSETVDPRDVEFPDASAIDLGVMERFYGEQMLKVPGTPSEKIRTLVFWDKDLKLIYGFAQLSAR